jgi:hypothetical protein
MKVNMIKVHYVHYEEVMMSQEPWLTPIILDTWEAEIRTSQLEASLGK